ncbi:MAG TPA: glycosyltransferase family 39 protein [Bacteroidota bacterium]
MPRWLPPLLWTLYLGVLSVIVFGLRSIGNMNVETDFYWTYVPVAKALLAGTLILDPFRGPGYELMLALFQVLSGEFFRAGLILSVLSASASLLLLYSVIRKTFDGETALLVAIGTALNPAFFGLSYTAGTDMFYVMLGLSVLFLIVHSASGRRWMLLGAGLLAGYTYLTRYNGIAVVVAASASILWLCDPVLPWRKRIGSILLFLGGAAVTLIPFGLYTHHETGRFVYNNNFLNVAYEIYAKGEIRWDDYWNVIAPHFHSYTDVVAYDPWRFLRHVGWNVISHGWMDLSLLVSWPIGVGAAAGALLMLRRELTRLQAVVLLFAALSFLVLVPVFYTERFSLFLVPFVVLFFVRFLQWRNIPRVPDRWARYASRSIALMVVIWTGFQCVTVARLDVAMEPLEILQVRDAFAGLAGDAPRGTAISARKPHIAYYLALDYAPFPYVPSEAGLVDALRQARVDYVYISTYEVATRPGLEGLLDSHKVHPGLRPLISVLNPRSVLYRVIQDAPASP